MVIDKKHSAICESRWLFCFSLIIYILLASIISLARKAHKSPHCLNCGTPLKGKYCHACGQENLDHQESVWHLFRHFFEDITHYDGKLWKTAKPLLIKPGFLTMEYLQGRRASYLNPVRMFIFLNFLFFLLWFSLPDSHKADAESTDTPQSSMNFKVNNDAAFRASIDSTQIDSIVKVKIGSKTNLGLPISRYSSVAEYDSIQSITPDGKKDGFMTSMLRHRMIIAQEQAQKNPEFFKDKFLETFHHNIPKLNFLFLIMCSLILYLVYYRRHLFMVNHAFFAIHLACTFLLLSVLMLLVSYIPHGIWLALVIFLYGNYYFYLALRHVYQQPAGKTIAKFFIINLFLALTMLAGIVVTLFYSVFG